MAKPMLLAIAPVQSQSGYGKHAVDLIKAIIRMNKYDVKILPIRWGNTPLNALEPGKDDEIISRILNSPQLPKQPELTFQVSVPNEFQPIGQYNIGVTAGVETTIFPFNCIEGLNKMHLGIVPSEFVKNTIIKTEYTKNNSQTNQPIGQLKCERPIEVLFEGVDTEVFKKIDDTKIENTELKSVLNSIHEEFAFLTVGHWLQGHMGHDRKDIGMTAKVFLEAFKDMENPPALIMKISSATFSILDRNEMNKRLTEIKKSIQANKLPNIYLLHGQLTDSEMNQLYNYSKVKCMVSLTKGEGFGRPLLEFTMSGKPVIASGWSGHLDFLDKDLTMLLPGKLEPVHPSAVNDFILKEGQWFTADYNVAAGSLKEMYTNYNRYLSKAKKLMYQNKHSFSLDNMKDKMEIIFNKYVPEFPEELELKLPASANSIRKITLPKLKKAGD